MAKIDNKKVREIILNKYKKKCAYCGCKLTRKNYTIDHIKPKRRHIKEIYGKDTIENFNPCCASCNSSKSSFDLEKWRNEISLKYSRLLRDSSSFRLLVRFNLIKKNNKVVFYFEKFNLKNKKNG